MDTIRLIFKRGFCTFKCCVLHKRLTSLFFFLYPPETEKLSWNLNNAITNTHTFENHKVTFYCFKEPHKDMLMCIKTKDIATQTDDIQFESTKFNTKDICPNQACFLSQLSLSSSINHCNQISLHNPSSPNYSHMKHKESLLAYQYAPKLPIN